MKFTSWVLERLGEPSTWRGIAMGATAAGIGLNPDEMAAITTVGLSLVGAINVFKKDEKNR